MPVGVVTNVIAVILGILNLVSFFLMAFDKRRAKAGKWRIPEKALLTGLADCLPPECYDGKYLD